MPPPSATEIPRGYAFSLIICSGLSTVRSSWRLLSPTRMEQAHLLVIPVATSSIPCEISGSGSFEIRLDSLQLVPFEYHHLFYESRGSHGERLAVGRYLISDQGDVLVPFLSDERKNV